MQNGDDEAVRPRANYAPQSRATTDSGLRARQKVIGMGLKRLYGNVVDEQVPDDFADLLKRLESGSAEDGEPK